MLAYRVSNVQAYTVSSSGVFVAGLYCGCEASGLCLFVPPYSTLTSLLLRNYLWMPGVMLYMYIHSTATALAHNSRAYAYMYMYVYIVHVYRFNEPSGYSLTPS